MVLWFTGHERRESIMKTIERRMLVILIMSIIPFLLLKADGNQMPINISSQKYDILKQWKVRQDIPEDLRKEILLRAETSDRNLVKIMDILWKYSKKCEPEPVCEYAYHEFKKYGKEGYLKIVGERGNTELQQRKDRECRLSYEKAWVFKNSRLLSDLFKIMDKEGIILLEYEGDIKIIPQGQLQPMWSDYVPCPPVSLINFNGQKRIRFYVWSSIRANTSLKKLDGELPIYKNEDDAISYYINTGKVQIIYNVIHMGKTNPTKRFVGELALGFLPHFSDLKKEDVRAYIEKTFLGEGLNLEIAKKKLRVTGSFYTQRNSDGFDQFIELTE